MIEQSRFLIKRLKILKHFGVFFVVVILFLMPVIKLNAQEIGSRIPITIAAKKPVTSPRPKPAVSQRTQRVKAKTTIRTSQKIVKVRTSNLAISSQIGAKVELEFINAKGVSVKLPPKTVKRDETNDDEFGSIEFEGITPGKYKITVSKDGFVTSEDEDINLPNEKTIGVNLILEPIKYNLVIQTNMREGEIRYAPAKLLETTRDGKRKTQETGGYCVAPIKNGLATVVGLETGYYNIDIRPNDNTIEYDQLKTSIKVPEEVPEADDDINNAENARKIEIDLEKKISTGTFSTTWSNAEWNLPNGWRLGNSLKTNRTTGIALPKNEQYRYYTNFEMISDVASLDDNIVGFVFRAEDEGNYYLLQIAGEKAAEPFVAKGFMVRNGQPQQIFSNPIPHFAKTIAAKKSFRVLIRGKDNVFEVFIEDSEDGKVKPVGNIIDRDRIFSKGAVGIVAVNNSNFEVASFTVCAPNCQ